MYGYVCPQNILSGDPSIQYDFRVARNTVSLLVPEVCHAIVEEYKDEVISCPIYYEKNDISLSKWAHN